MCEEHSMFDSNYWSGEDNEILPGILFLIVLFLCLLTGAFNFVKEKSVKENHADEGTIELPTEKVSRLFFQHENGIN